MNGFKEYLEEYRDTPHYHGDVVRIIFIAIGIVMTLGLPLFKNNFNYPYTLPILIIIFISLFAGITSPKLFWIAVIDLLISIAGFCVFEYIAIVNFTKFDNLFAALNQLIAVMFFFAIYFNTKTVRAFILREQAKKS